MRPLRILLLEPHYGGSHKSVACGLVRHSRHRITLDILPPRNWKWRLRAAGMIFACRHAANLQKYDLVVASSLQNLADFRAVCGANPGHGRRVGRMPPVILYMHESQLSYPLQRELPAFAPNEAERHSPSHGAGRRSSVTPAAGGERKDWGLLFADVSSALAADRIVFNSRHHRKTFLEGLERLLAFIPDTAPRGLTRLVRSRSCIASPGVEMSDIPAPGSVAWTRARGSLRRDEQQPLILWNHRWEFDKRPGEFFAALKAAREKGARFRLALIGEPGRVVPKVFLAAREQFGNAIDRYGRVASRTAYVRWLARADLAVSTSEHENFGISWLEAMAAGAFPVLPRREAYPELLPASLHGDHLYSGREDLVRRIVDLATHPLRIDERRNARSRIARRFSWERRIGALDAFFEDVAGRTARRA